MFMKGNIWKHSIFLKHFIFAEHIALLKGSILQNIKCLMPGFYKLLLCKNCETNFLQKLTEKGRIMVKCVTWPTNEPCYVTSTYTE